MTWAEDEQRALAADVALTVARLREHLGRPDAGVGEARAARDRLPAGGSLDRLAAAFGLSKFERDLLLLAVADELDTAVGELCGALNAGRHDRPTFGLALSFLEDPHWSALTPRAPLRHHRLIEVGEGRLTSAPVALDERVLHHLLGVREPDRRLRPYLRACRVPDLPPPSVITFAAERVRAAWTAPRGPREPVPPAVLHGPEAADQLAVAVHAAGDAPVHRAAVRDLPTAAADRDTFVRLWTREALLDGAVLALVAEPGEDAAGIATRLEGPVVVCGEEPAAVPGAAVPIEVPRPSRAEQRALWTQVLTGHPWAAQIDQATMQFDLGYTDIATATAGGLDGCRSLWDVCRRRARTGLDDLAQRVEPRATWADLVLPGEQKDVLRDLVAQVRGRARVHGDWGFERAGARGLGISALFAGLSGTGKTLAAEVIAADLGLDLYRVDLSGVVSKYIGETEKNLRAVFAAAERGGCVLLFDEADAIFGKRTEVKDSHDRYANIEVGYLLQRMENYRGLAVLTTNMRSALDPAFLRRLRFVVQFPFPDHAQRAGIWLRAFPAEVPLDALDPARLAQLNIAGGNIRNIALHAAFLAADEDAPVRMGHVMRAARAEYAKLDRPLTAAETGGW
ncbi:ATPase [Actinorhabdospora filicis]|uniref:ATPase n=1 Tax=Actinorhabdospora filicis TaxID=1785913 RepID=A0A9W6SRC0_9ACTN|nr:ATP-binding protein [Actinorhabdospora filicis]GLZ81509.1 ATPase [Actinorhabdospora filicis]